MKNQQFIVGLITGMGMSVLLLQLTDLNSAEMASRREQDMNILKENAILMERKVDSLLSRSQGTDLSSGVMESMHAIGIRVKTDKELHHGYGRFFETFLAPYRVMKDIKFLEIGMKDGASVELWKEYFHPSTRLFGIDRDSGQTRQVMRHHKDVTVVLGDQEDKRFLSRFVTETGGNFDIIVDDGGHDPKQQIASFDVLFEKALKPGGVYIIEDIETSYWRAGIMYGKVLEYGINHEKSAVNVFKRVIDTINREFHGLSYSTGRRGEQYIKTITFAQNCIIITKKDASDAPYEDREYRFRKDAYDISKVSRFIRGQG